jgi:hypothetical protein
MSRFLLCSVAISIFAADLGAQSPTPPGKAVQTASKSPAVPGASPSATPTAEDLVNS